VAVKKTHESAPEEGGEGKKKLHIEIERELLKKVEDYIAVFNDDPNRMTRRMKKVDVINLALSRYLKAHQ